MRKREDGKAGKKRYRGALDSHLKDIRKYDLLTPSGEFRVASASRRGEGNARNELVQANLRLVVKIAKAYRTAGVDLDELIAEGELGLIEAANRFDPARGVRFVAYAPYWIRKYVLLALGRNTRQTTVPAAERDGTRDDDRPSKRRRRILSLEEFLDDSGERRVVESVASTADTRAEDVVLENELAAALRALLPKLSVRDRTILAAHYGLDGGAPKSLQEIGKSLGLTRERIRQIELSVLARARSLLRRRPG